MSSWREGEFGQRPVRVANCSGYCYDDPNEMYKQATLGDVDFITGDYLAEANIASSAEAYAAGKHLGYEETAWEGLRQTIEVIERKKIKVAINGGALNPSGLAKRVAALVRERGLNVRVAFLSGDDIHSEVGATLPTTRSALWPHLDSNNPSVSTPKGIYPLVEENVTPIPIVSANAYLGARGIVEAFRKGADIVICGRVSDASPVIAAAWYWYSWKAEDLDQLAGSLIAGHLIECSAYVTGGNFSGFTKYSQDMLMLPGFPIAEIGPDGSCVITKHPGTGGIVNEDTVKSQLLYELQGNVYLHSDCKALLDDIRVEELALNRVRVSGIKGRPPNSTTKVAIFYKGGYEAQILLNANGHAYAEKCDLLQKQVSFYLSEEDLKRLDVLEFQQIGVPASNPPNQNSGTIYLRIFIASRSEKAVSAVTDALSKIGLKHHSGYHYSLDFRTAVPRPFITYYPAIWKQVSLTEEVHLVDFDSEEIQTIPVGYPPMYEELGLRDTYDTISPALFSGPYSRVRLGDVAQARSGDKGSNINIGIFVSSARQWNWLRSYLSRARMQDLVGEDWRDSYYMERVEFPHIYAVHFVIYGILERGVNSSSRLDCLGKGFADYIRDKLVDVPEDILE